MHVRFILIIVALAVAVGTACSPAGNSNTNTAAPNTASPAAVTKGGETPTEAYKMLYAAVKSRNTEAIKALVTPVTQSFAMALAQQQNSPIEKVYENGFTATTFAESLPEIRDERIDGDMGAVEVRNGKDNIWEDLPFIKDEGGWKLAVGDIFKGNYKKPGKPRSVIEQEAANAAGKGPQMMPAPGNTKMPPANANSKTSVPRP